MSIRTGSWPWRGRKIKARVESSANGVRWSVSWPLKLIDSGTTDTEAEAWEEVKRVVSAELCKQRKRHS